MKILFVIHSLLVGGSETVVTEYLTEMKALGQDVALLQMYHSETYLYRKLVEQGIPVYTVCTCQGGNSLVGKCLRRIDRRLLLRTRMNRLLRKIQPDIIHFHTNLPYMHRLSVDFTRTVYSFHTRVKRSLQAVAGFQKAFTEACRKGMRVVAISDTIRKETLEIVPECSVTTILNGIDIAGVRRQTMDKGALCRSLSIPEDAFLMGHVGRFHPVKNHEKLIDVFREVRKRRPDAHLLLVGDGDAQRTLELKNRVERSQLTDAVHFLGIRSDAKAIMSVLDCFVLPSHAEGFPLVLGEAQAHGVRCVATAAVPEEAFINENAFALDVAETDEKWAEYILGDFVQNHGRCLDSIDLKHTVQAHLDLYEKALRGAEQ